jgi:SPP1 family predicted phage head-tail adaptor
MSLAVTLNRRVTLQAMSSAQDATGEEVNGWADVVTVWASVIDISGREFVAAMAEQSSTQTKVAIRYRDGITTSMRLIYSGRIYDIEAVLGEDRRTLTLMCAKGGNV